MSRMNYPSDIVGGHLVATAVMERLHSDAEFKRDLACAKEEHSIALHPGEELSPACRQRQSQLGQAQAPTVQPLPVSLGLAVLAILPTHRNPVH
jgi:hypothetical protein